MQILAKVVTVILCTHSLQHRRMDFKPLPHHGDGRVVGIRILHPGNGGQRIAVGADGEPLHHMFVFGMRRAEIVM